MLTVFGKLVELTLKRNKVQVNIEILKLFYKLFVKIEVTNLEF